MDAIVTIRCGQGTSAMNADLRALGYREDTAATPDLVAERELVFLLWLRSMVEPELAAQVDYTTVRDGGWYRTWTEEGLAVTWVGPLGEDGA